MYIYIYLYMYVYTYLGICIYVYIYMCVYSYLLLVVPSLIRWCQSSLKASSPSSRLYRNKRRTGASYGVLPNSSWIVLKKWDRLVRQPAAPTTKTKPWHFLALVGRDDRVREVSSPEIPVLPVLHSLILRGQRSVPTGAELCGNGSGRPVDGSVGLGHGWLWTARSLWHLTTKVWCKLTSTRKVAITWLGLGNSYLFDLFGCPMCNVQGWGLCNELKKWHVCPFTIPSSYYWLPPNTKS